MITLGSAQRPGVSSGTCCTWRNRPRRGCCLWQLGNVRGGVVPRPANEGGRTAGPGLRGGGLLLGSHRRAAGSDQRPEKAARARAAIRCQTTIEGPGAGLRRGPPRRPEKAAWGRYSGGRDTGQRCQTAIEGHRVGRWRGPPRRPEKVAWGRYSGGRDTGPSALPDRNCGPRSSVLVNATKAPRISGV